ncbi:MAG: DUF6642 family protein [Bacteroidia bacterium]
MKIAKAYQKDVFCLEGDWNTNLLKQNSVQAALEFLKQNRKINYIHRHCGTLENLKHYTQQWQLKRYSQFSILYLAFHGKPGKILINKIPVTLDDLAIILGPKCHNRIIHFGSCQTLSTDKRIIKRFLRQTNALCVCGFGKEIGFIEGSVFDILLIDMFQEFKNVHTVYKNLTTNYKTISKKLQFKMVYL